MLELAPGRLFDFLRWERDANSKEGRLLKGALILFTNFWAQNDTIFISSSPKL